MTDITSEVRPVYHRKTTAILTLFFSVSVLLLLLATQRESTAALSVPDYTYAVDPTGYVCGTTGPSPGIVELKMLPQGSRTVQVRVRKCAGGDFSLPGTYQVWVDTDADGDFDNNDYMIASGSYSAGQSTITRNIDPVAASIPVYGPRDYMVKVYSQDQPTIAKHTGIIRNWEQYSLPAPPMHDRLYGAESVGSTCGNIIQAQFTPNNSTRQIDISISKCDGSTFNQGGKAYVYVDNVPHWGVFTFSAGGTVKQLGSIDPLDLGLVGVHSYKVVAYSSDQPTNPNKFSGNFLAWEIYPVPNPPAHGYYYGATPSGYSDCGSYIKAQFLPNHTTHEVDVNISKCDGTNFTQGGRAYVYVDGTPQWGPFTFQSGEREKQIGSIDPVDLQITGSHNYKVVIYSNDQPTNPNKYSAEVSVWESDSPAIPVDPPSPPPGGSCPVPFYWQSDPHWGANSFGTCTCDISHCGCAITSVAMLFQYYGASHDPGSLAACMNTNACPLNWGSNTVDNCSNGKVDFTESANFSWARLETELQRGPVILQLNRAGGMHFVVVVSGSGSDAQGYLVNDPALKQGARMKLSDVLARRNYAPASMRLFSGTPTCQVASEAYEQSLAEFGPELSFIEPIAGAIIPYRNTETTMTIEIVAQSSMGNVTEMLIWTDSIANTTWQPFTPYVELPLSNWVFAQFRDDVGNISDVVSISFDPESAQQVNFLFLPVGIKN